MKNKLIKIISSILVLACLLSCLTVLSFAAEGAGEEEVNKETLPNIDEQMHVHFNRTFDEGWTLKNGTGGDLNDNVDGLESEVTDDGRLNYYAFVESMGDNSGHFAITYDAKPTEMSILEFDVKVDDYYNAGNVLYSRSPGGSSTGTIVQNMLNINESVVSVFGHEIGKLNKGWLHIAYVMDMDQTNYLCTTCNKVNDLDTDFFVHKDDGVNCMYCNANLIVHMIAFRVYFGLSETFDINGAVNANIVSGEKNLEVTHYIDYNFANANPNKAETWKTASLDFFRFGPGLGNRTDCAGQKIKFDNIKLYSYLNPVDEEGNRYSSSTAKLNTLENYGYGALVNAEMQKTIATGGQTGGSKNDILMEGLMFKVGSDFMYHKEEQLKIYTAEDGETPYGQPVKIDDIVYVPFEPILKMTGYPYLWHQDGISCDISTASGSSTLTLGRDVAVINGEVVQLTAAPMMVEADRVKDVYYPVLALGDVEKFFSGYYVSYDEMGLIGICEAENVFDRDGDLGQLLTYMKAFVFEYLTGEEYYERIKENTNNFDHPYMLANQEKFDEIHKVYLGEIEDDMYYKLTDRYVKVAESTYQRFTTKPANPAVTATNNYGIKDPDYELLYFELTSPQYCGIEYGQWITDRKFDYGQFPCLIDGLAVQPEGYVGKDFNYGCDISGRGGDANSMSEQIQALALGYQITRDVKYAKLAYEMVISLDKNFAHWDHPQMLGGAETAGKLGRVYDWLYDIWTELNYDTNFLAQKIYERCIWFGYVVTVDKDLTDWFEDYSGQPGTTRYNDMVINWNAVCTGGFVNAMLAIIGAEDIEGKDFKVGFDCNDKPYTEIDYTYTRGHFDNTDNLNILHFLLSQNFKDLAAKGLDQYAPDGSFIESPGYWGFATNNLQLMMWGLKTAVGDDLGYWDFWGANETFYFPIHVEYSSEDSRYGYYYWNYHDSGNGTSDTIAYYSVAKMFNDPALAAIRTDHINNGRAMSWRDLIAYEIGYGDLKMDEVEFSNDYYGQTLHCLFTRSSWDKGALFAGLMGHANNVTAHGQMDAGNIFYVNKGHNWIVDMGTENYDVYGLWGGMNRYGYYRNNPEGANSVLLLDIQDKLEYGQQYAGSGKFMKNEYESTEYGSKAILDMTSIFAPYVSSAYRGMLFTNNRETVVVQDQIDFTGMREFAWLAHTKDKCSVSRDGRQITLTAKLKSDGLQHSVRLSIVSEDTKLKFEVIDAGVTTHLLEVTHEWGHSEKYGMVPQDSRDDYNRIMIRSTGMKLNLAVVIEYIPPYEEISPIPEYNYTNMFNWEITDGSQFNSGSSSGSGSGSSSGSGSGGTEESIGTAELSHIAKYTDDAVKLINSNYAFGNRTSDFFKNLARVNNAVNTYRPETLPQVLKNKYQEYLGCLAKYNAFKDEVNSKLDLDRAIAIGLIGGSVA